MDKNEFTSGVNFASSVNPKNFAKLQDDVSKLENELRAAKNNFEKSRFEIITLIGVFVGLITYLGLEIQVFKSINNPLLIIGISLFFIASILLFILTIDLILKKSGEIRWSNLNNPLYIILIILLIISIFFILSGTGNQLTLQPLYYES